jgi:hypothetical protein
MQVLRERGVKRGVRGRPAMRARTLVVTCLSLGTGLNHAIDAGGHDTLSPRGSLRGADEVFQCTRELAKGDC